LERELARGDDAVIVVSLAALFARLVMSMLAKFLKLEIAWRMSMMGESMTRLSQHQAVSGQSPPDREKRTAHNFGAVCSTIYSILLLYI
jgi:hypothetical protein